jgi:hypothetical protein
MKAKFIAFFTLLLTAVSVFSQVPQAFNYQAVLRNSSGQILPNQQVLKS